MAMAGPDEDDSVEWSCCGAMSLPRLQRDDGLMWWCSSEEMTSLM